MPSLNIQCLNWVTKYNKSQSMDLKGFIDNPFFINFGGGITRGSTASVNEYI